MPGPCSRGLDRANLPLFAGSKQLAYDNDFDTPEPIAVALTRPESALVFGG